MSVSSVSYRTKLFINLRVGEVQGRRVGYLPVVLIGVVLVEELGPKVDERAQRCQNPTEERALLPKVLQLERLGLEITVFRFVVELVVHFAIRVPDCHLQRSVLLFHPLVFRFKDQVGLVEVVGGHSETIDRVLGASFEGPNVGRRIGTVFVAAKDGDIGVIFGIIPPVVLVCVGWVVVDAGVLHVAGTS